MEEVSGVMKEMMETETMKRKNTWKKGLHNIYHTEYGIPLDMKIGPHRSTSHTLTWTSSQHRRSNCVSSAHTRTDSDDSTSST